MILPKEKLHVVYLFMRMRPIFFFNCMITGGKKVVAILDIPLPELKLVLEKAYFCRTRTCKNCIRELELELGLAKIG